MIEVLQENPLLLVFLVSGLLANIICLPFTIRDRRIKPLSTRIIEQAMKDETWHIGTLIKQKYHPSRRIELENGRHRDTPESYTAWYQYEYRTFIKTAKVELVKRPQDKERLYYRKGHPFKVYCTDGFQVNGARYNWIFIRTLVVWIALYLILYLVFFGEQLWMEMLQHGM